jgi:hypothetical protein
MLNKKLFLIGGLLAMNGIAQAEEERLDVKKLIEDTEKAARLGNGETVTVSFDQLPPELANQLREISQKLEQQEKDRKRQDIWRTIVIGLMIGLFTVVRIYRKK